MTFTEAMARCRIIAARIDDTFCLEVAGWHYSFGPVESRDQLKFKVWSKLLETSFERASFEDALASYEARVAAKVVADTQGPPAGEDSVGDPKVESAE
jgi:hypothetical protein